MAVNNGFLVQLEREFNSKIDNVDPVNKGWQQRLDLCNLYPLLLHLNLFSLGHLGQVRIV